MKKEKGLGSEEGSDEVGKRELLESEKRIGRKNQINQAMERRKKKRRNFRKNPALVNGSGGKGESIKFPEVTEEEKTEKKRGKNPGKD